MKTKELLTDAFLAQFTGTTQYYKNFLGLLYTDGIQAMAETGGAYWLIDAIASFRRRELFQVWKLTVSDNKGALTMQEDSDQPIIVKQKIPFTDFPLESIEFFVIDNVLMLKSEY